MIFNINFFLFNFALSCIYSYTCVYAKHYANISNVEFGTLAMVLPILALVAKPIVCSLADARGCHKSVLLCALTTFGLGYGSLGLVPFFKDPADHEHDSLAWLLIALLMTIGNLSVACIYSMNDALASNYARKHNRSYARMRIFANFGWATGALLIMSIGDLIAWLPFRVLGCAILSLLIVADIFILLVWPYPEDFEMFHDGSTVAQRKLSLPGPNTVAALAELRKRNSISRDMLARIRQGRSKSVGSLPRRPDHFERLGAGKLPMVGIMPTIMENGKLSSRGGAGRKAGQQEKEDEYSDFQCQLILLRMIASGHRSFARNLVLFALLGTIIGIVFNFEYDYFKERIVAHDDAQQFEFLTGLCMIAQVIPGEVLLNFFAVDLFRLFGQSANMSLALVCIGLRCFFYANILPYAGNLSVLVSECLHGPSVGLYWVLAVDVGSHYALMVSDYLPELKRRGIVRDARHEQQLAGCLRATSIAIMSSSAEGLGMALGSLLGGYISSSHGYAAMWNCCAALGMSAGFANLGWDLMRKLPLNANDSNEHDEGKRQDKSAIRKVPTIVIDAPPPPPPPPPTPNATKL